MKIYLSLFGVLLLVGAGCTAQTNTTVDVTDDTSNADTSMDVSYDQNSWKEIIADSCKSFSDGCNTCSRMEGSDDAACTRKACEVYEKPVCLDSEVMTPEEQESETDGAMVSTTLDLMVQGDADVSVDESSGEVKATDYNSSRSNRTTN